MSDPAVMIQALDEAGYHVTEPRRAVAEMIASRTGRFTALDLVHEARRARRGVGRATVFRSLELFESLGLVERIHLPTGEHAFVACDPVHHHHVVCTRCGRSTEVLDIGMGPIARAIEASTGFAIDEHRVEFLGLCPDCRGRQAPPA